MKMKKNIIIIPSRLQATRFPNKPLVDINGLPMIVMVAKQAEKANIGEVVVACGDVEIFDVVKQHGINAIMTDNDLPSGSDRIYQALTKLEEKFDNIINVQGDVPTINPETIKIVANALNQDDKVAVSTACAKITDKSEINNPNVVKCYADFSNGKIAQATDFNREAIGNEPFYHHIGIYGYKSHGLEQFINLKPSKNEIKRKLEQMRLIDNGLIINACLVDEIPIGIDIAQDLEKLLDNFKK